MESAASAQTDKVYVDFGGHVSEVPEDVAKTLNPKSWEVFFFKRGYSPKGNSHAPGLWGMQFDQDRNMLMESVRKTIVENNAYRNSSLCDALCRNNDEVWDNYFDPIAILDKNSTSDATSVMGAQIGQLQKKVDLLTKMWENFKAFAGGMTPDEMFDRLQKKVKSLDPGAIKGYVENFQRGQKQIAGLRAALEGIAQAGNPALLLSQATQDLDAAQNNGLKIQQALNQPDVNYNDASTLTLPNTNDRTDMVLTRQMSIDDASGRLIGHGTVTYTQWVYATIDFSSQLDACRDRRSDDPNHFSQDDLSNCKSTIQDEILQTIWR